MVALTSNSVSEVVKKAATTYNVFDVQQAFDAAKISVDYKPALYPEYLPSTETGAHGEDEHGEFEHIEPGTRADPAMPNVKGLPTYKEETITPFLGSYVSGVQLSELSPAGLDEVALLATQRGVVVFLDQDLKDKGIQKWKDFGTHFGPLHRHPTQSCVRGHNDLQIVYEGPEPGGEKMRIENSFGTKNSYVRWHADQAQEPQPPAVSMLVALEVPASGGGDTLFSSTTMAYKRLSEPMQKFISTLWHECSSKRIVELSGRMGGPVRRPPVPIAHPLVTIHPTTGERCLYWNPLFGGRILGLRQEESDAIGKFLTHHLTFGQDFQCRAKWAPGAIVVYDQRVVNHSQTLDYDVGDRRHLLRITPLGGRPIPTPEAGERPDLSNQKIEFSY